jgi:hypothetical protein
MTEVPQTYSDPVFEVAKAVLIQILANAPESVDLKNDLVRVAMDIAEDFVSEFQARRNGQTN